MKEEELIMEIKDETGYVKELIDLMEEMEE